MSEQNVKMTHSDAPEKIFSGEMAAVTVPHEEWGVPQGVPQGVQKSHEVQGTNEKGVDE